MKNEMRNEMRNIKDEIFEFESILAFITISVPCFIKCMKTFLPCSPLNQWIVVTASQYTNWNLCLVVINHFHNNHFMNIFLTINSSTIFIVYHLFYLSNKPLIRKIPNIPEFFTDFHIDVINVIVHVIPCLGFIHHYSKNPYYCDFNMGYNVTLFNMIWALQCFVGFDPHTVYFKISDSNVYKLWIFLISLNLTIGHSLQK